MEKLAKSFRAQCLAHPFGAMAGKSMSYLMPHDHGNAIVVLGDRHDAFPEGNLAPGEGKGVNFFALKDAKLPFVIWLICCRSDALSNPAQLCLPIVAIEGVARVSL
jgi:hypothetical protein